MLKSPMDFTYSCYESAMIKIKNNENEYDKRV